MKNKIKNRYVKCKNTTPKDFSKDAIVNKISKLIKSDDSILFAYIFGSFAQSNNFSDIDIAIYLKCGSDIKKEFELENELESKLKIPVDVRIINNAPVAFVYNVLNKNILIKDNERRSDFEGQTLKNYFDYVHLLDEYLKEAVYA